MTGSHQSARDLTVPLDRVIDGERPTVLVTGAAADSGTPPPGSSAAGTGCC